jgi:hypothetical protein
MGHGTAKVTGVLVLLLLAGTAMASPWRILAPGLELATFADITVLRVDPDAWETVALAHTDVGGDRRTPAAWAADFGLTAVINAGMFATDHATHTGYFRTGEHVNNGVWVRRDYRQIACFEPREDGLPRFRLQDLDLIEGTDFAERYEVVIQNIRLVRRPGQNRWSPSKRRWSEACLGEDSRGRMLWIHASVPRDMHTLVDVLLDLPLDLVAAQHLEGGRQAQLWVAGEPIADHGLPLPNILGIRPRR